MHVYLHVHVHVGAYPSRCASANVCVRRSLAAHTSVHACMRMRLCMCMRTRERVVVAMPGGAGGALGRGGDGGSAGG